MKIYILLFVCLSSIAVLSQNPSITVDKIIKSGDGQTIKTAYKVNSVNEEYEVLKHLKLKCLMQKLHIKNGDFYDEITTNTKTIYFKIVAKKIENKNLPQVI